MFLEKCGEKKSFENVLLKAGDRIMYFPEGTISASTINGRRYLFEEGGDDKVVLKFESKEEFYRFCFAVASCLALKVAKITERETGTLVCVLK